MAELRVPERNEWWGLPADALAKLKKLGAVLAQSSSPFASAAGNLVPLVVGNADKALEKMSYGERVTTGQGETLRPDPDLLDVAGLVPSPMKGVTAAKGVAEALAGLKMLPAMAGMVAKAPEILGPVIRFKGEIFEGGPTHGVILNKMRQDGILDLAKEKPAYADTRLWKLSDGSVVGEEEAMAIAGGKRTEDMMGAAGEAAREHERKVRAIPPPSFTGIGGYMYWDPGVPIIQDSWPGNPAVVLERIESRTKPTYYKIRVDTSKDPNALDENGEKVFEKIILESAENLQRLNKP